MPGNTAFGSVMLSPFAVILIPQSREKDLRSSLMVNSAKHPGIFSALFELSNAGILLPRLRDQNDRRWRFPLRMTNNPYEKPGVGIQVFLLVTRHSSLVTSACGEDR